MDPKKTGNLISKARGEKGLTQKELASKLHITDKAVSKWERGISLPDISLFIPISELLGISLYELLGGTSKNDKLGQKDVDDMIKKTIKKGKEDNRWKHIIKNIVIGILSFLIFVFMVLFLLDFTNLVNYFDPYRPEKIKISDYDQYNIVITNRYLLNEDNALCNYENKNCIGQLISALPLSKETRPMANEQLDTLIYTYSISEQDYNKMFYDKNYVKKGMIVTSLKEFIIMKELDALEFNFTDKLYKIHRDDVIYFFKEKKISFNDLTKEEVWTRHVIEKLNDQEFRDSFPIIEN